jgi:site-specific DNA recombinase
MYVRAESLKYYCRKCCNKIPVQDLENIVRDELKLFFGQHDRVSRHLEEAGRNVAEKTALLDAHLYAPAEERKTQLEAELPRLQAEVDFLKVNKLSADDVVHESANLHERWPSMSPEDRRKIVEALIEKIVISDTGIDITYSHLPSSEELCKSQQSLGPG